MPFVGPALTSLHNPHVKFARSLAHRKVRYRERAFVVESTRLYEDAIRAGFLPVRLFLDPSRVEASQAERLIALAGESSFIHEVSTEIIEAITNTETPQGIAAIFTFPEVSINQRSDAPLFVVADGIKDPGNLGTLMRTAVAAGADALFCSTRTVDPYAPKVVRAAMGAHFRLPVRALDWNDRGSIIVGVAQRLAAEADEGEPYDLIDWRRPSVLVLGSEASGVSGHAANWLTGRVKIPMSGDVESLNAAMAGAVILFEAARQRRTQK